MHVQDNGASKAHQGSNRTRNRCISPSRWHHLRHWCGWMNQHPKTFKSPSWLQSDKLISLYKWNKFQFININAELSSCVNMCELTVCGNVSRCSRCALRCEDGIRWIAIILSQTHPYQRYPEDTQISMWTPLQESHQGIEPCNAALAVVAPPGGGDADQLCSFYGAHAQTLPKKPDWDGSIELLAATQVLLYSMHTIT